MAASEVKLPPGFELDQPKVPDGFVLDQTDAQRTMASVPMRVVQGMRDPIDAGAQALTHILPDSVVRAGNAANNWLADKTGMVGRIPAGGVDQMISDQEAQYQSARQATGNQGIDWARIAGNVASPANLAIASRIPATSTVASKMASMIGIGPGAASTIGRTAAAAGGGAVYGSLSPVSDGGDFATEKAKQIGIGAAAGPAAQLIGGAAARVISPHTSEDVIKLMKEGITPTPGQILGGRWQVTEDKLQSVPILGDAIASARGKGIDELNLAAYKRALEPIGGVVPAKVGRDAVASVRDQVSGAYNALLPKVQFKADSGFASDIQTLQQMASNLPPDQAARFDKILRDNVIGKMTRQGSMDGETLKGIESQLGELSRGLKSDSLFDNRQLGSAIGEIQAAIRSNLERANPQYADELKAANTAWANYTRIRDAASRQGADEGKFTPAQLSAAVRAGDKTKGKRAFSEGDALMQDLSDPAKSVLASKYPDSGTTGRAIMGLAVGGGAAYLNPTVTALTGVGITPYLPGGRQVAAALLARRPQGAEAVAESVRRLAPAASPALIGLTKQ